MRDHSPSFTARWVAGCRGLAHLLPPEDRLVDDPLGLSFAGRPARLLSRLGRAAPGLFERLVPLGGPLSHTLLWLQVRSKALDEAVREFVASGGKQLVLLGAGFDARAVRLRELLGPATVYEVDHPATQLAKRREIARSGLPSAEVRYVPWDFERDPMGELPARLEREGLDRGQRTLTLWEGVTMYLTPEAIESSVGAVRELGAPGSLLAMTYFDVTHVKRPSRAGRVAAALVARAGEPWKFGWDPAELSSWLSARGFSLVRDEPDEALMRRWMSGRYGRLLEGRGHVALAETR